MNIQEPRLAPNKDVIVGAIRESPTKSRQISHLPAFQLQGGDTLSIHLYNSNKKKLISFDYSMIGSKRIIRVSKGIQTLKR